MKQVNIALIGFGYWGPNLARNFDQLSETRLSLICDLDEKKLAKVKKLYPQTKITKNYDDILNDPGVEAVVITAAAATHHELTKKALLQGKHVFVEKPLTLSVETSKELVELAEKQARVLMVGHLLEYHSAIERIKAYLDAGEVGDVLYLYSQRLNLGKIRKDENALWSLAPHDISVILYLLGEEPVEISCQGQSYLRDKVEDVIFLSLIFPDKVIAHAHVSWLDPHKIRKLTIVGSKKMIVFDDMESAEKIKIYDKGVEPSPDYKSYGEDLTLRFGDITVPSIKMKEPLRTECSHFVDCIINNKKPRSDGQDGLRVLKVLEAAQMSMDSGGKPVKTSSQ